MPEDDFGFGGQQTIVAPDEPKEDPKEEPKDDLSNDKNKDDVSDIQKDVDKNEPENDVDDNDKDKDDKDSLFKQIKPGVQLEISDKTYTVDENNNLVDEKGNIFKKADELEEYLKTLEQSDEDANEELNIDSIQEALGVGIVDEDGKEVKFENTPEGIKQYINAVVETQQQEIAETTLNTLWDKYPVIKEVLDYYIANGESLEGFNSEAPNYDIDIDDNDESQQESIIKLAWKEQNRRGNVDDYIAYLKSSGKLLSVAEEELEGLKESAKEKKQALAKKAQEIAQQQQEEQEQYWQGVKSVIDSKKIAGYKIPDTIIIKREGKSIAVTPNDFFNYIYRVDKEGVTQYQRDLMKDSAESRRDDEILRAFLKFTGGTYANLVDMAISEKEVTKLKFKAKANREHRNTVKVKTTTPKSGKEIELGY